MLFDVFKDIYKGKQSVLEYFRCFVFLLWNEINPYKRREGGKTTSWLKGKNPGYGENMQSVAEKQSEMRAGA